MSSNPIAWCHIQFDVLDFLRGKIALPTDLIPCRLIQRMSVRKKVLNCLITLYIGVGESAAKVAEPTLLQVNTALYESLPSKIEELLLLEGQAASAYFRAWRNVPLRWKGTGRHPIPDEWHRIGSRGSSLSSGNRRATHPVNALLNYAYAVLEGQVRRAIVVEGLDPAIGILHAIQSGRASLVYDL